MTTTQETITDAARRGQDAITSFLRIWADGMQSFVPVTDVKPDTKLRGAVDVVDNMFDLAEQILATQRELTKSWLNVTSKAAFAAQSAVKDAAGAAQDIAAPARNTAKKS
ncbi:MAG: hypothetical protein ACRDSR_05765 [Pseudonocardiaceae bacterium]